MADLFDMNVAGYGFHLTNHVLALVALIVACFAITGYISFRNASVPGKALKSDHQMESVLVDFPVNTTTLNRDFKLSQPANTVLVSIETIGTEDVDLQQNINFRLGTQSQGTELVGDTQITAAQITPLTATFQQPTTTAAQMNARITDKRRDLFLGIRMPANTITDVGEAGSLTFRFDFYEYDGVSATAL